MSGFIRGKARTQTTLFPEQFDDYVLDDNPVGVIDVFVDGIDLSALEFKTIPAVTGQSAYHPETTLKLIIMVI